MERARKFKELTDAQLQEQGADNVDMRIELLGRQSYDRERRLEALYSPEWLAEMESAHE